MNPGTFFTVGTSYNQANGSSYGGNDLQEFLGDTSNWSNGEDMWYLPAGAAFFQNNDQAITQTAEGVNVGGMDLLDYLALDNFGMDGTSY